MPSKPQKNVFRPLCPPFSATAEEGYFLPLRDGNLLVRAVSGGLTLCHTWPRTLPRPERPGTLIGFLNDRPCHAFALPAASPGARSQQGPGGHTFREVRSLFGLLNEGEYAAAVTAAEVVHFETTYRRCPACGGELGPLADRWGRRCAPCARDFEPAVQPTLMGLVHDGLQVVLVQPHVLPRDVWTLPAAGVLPGLGLEESLSCFLRRTLDLQVEGLSYHGSLPWPYPDRLMIGLHGRAEARTLHLEADPHHFRAARWFHVDDLPALPPPISLARRLADWYAQLPRLNGRPSVPKH